MTSDTKEPAARSQTSARAVSEQPIWRWQPPALNLKLLALGMPEAKPKSALDGR